MAEKSFVVALTARIDQYLAAMGKAKTATSDVASAGADLDKLGGTMKKVGGFATSHLTLPLVGAAAGAIKLSSDFETSFARMQGLAGVTAGEVDGLKKSVLTLAGETAQAPQDLADALYEASSAGLNTAQALDAVKLAAKASAAGMGPAKDIVGLVASATASYGAANIDAAHATDVLTAAVRAGRADPEELAGSLGKVLPIASQLGVSFDEVSGATAFLSNIFGDTAKTVTALQGFLTKLVAPSQQGRQALIDMGTSVEDLQAAISKDGLQGALELLKEKGFAGNQQALRALFDDIEGYQGALALLNDNSGTLGKTMDAVTGSTGALDSAFSTVSDTAGFKMKQAWSDMQVALIKAGDVIMPIVEGVAGAVAKLADKFGELPPVGQKIVLGFLAIVAAAGPVLKVGGSLISNFKAIKAGMEKAHIGATEMGAGMVVAGLAVYAFSQQSKQAAERADAVKKSLGELSTVADDQVWQKFGEAWGAALLAGKSADDMFKQLADTNLVGAKRLLAVGEASGQSAAMLDSLRAAIAGADAAAAQGAKTEDTYATSATNAGAAHGVFTNLLDSFGAKVTAATGHLGAQKEAEDAAKAALDDLKKSLQDALSPFEQLANAASSFSKAMDEVMGGQRGVTETSQALIADTQALSDKVAENEAALKKNKKALDDSATSLDVNTNTGRANRDMVKGLSDDILANAAAQVRNGTSTADAAASVDNMTESLRQQLAGLGFNTDQVNEYIASLGNTPENVTTAIQLVNDEETKKRLEGILDQMTTIDAGAAAEIQADIDDGKFAEAEAALEQLTKDRQVNIYTHTSGGGGAPNRTATGRFTVGGSNYLTTLGETPGAAGNEVTLPLGNQRRMQNLLAMPQVLPYVSAAMMGVSGAGAQPAAPTATPVVNNSISFGDIVNTVDMQAAWQQAQFALAAAA